MQKLIEEVKFWKVLSRKFDELEYEFNVHPHLCRIAAPPPPLPSCGSYSKLNPSLGQFWRSFFLSRKKSSG
jgi:hypothetical protein